MDIISAILPHCVWALAAVVSVHKLVDWLKGKHAKELVKDVQVSVDSLRNLHKMTAENLGDNVIKLQNRLDKLESTPVARKQVF